ncbi:MAG: hypothetical protein MJ089_05950 [Ruminococcus sp.]|nr:hypothetical protein [Ruminococcus sp.]
MKKLLSMLMFAFCIILLSGCAGTNDELHSNVESEFTTTVAGDKKVDFSLYSDIDSIGVNTPANVTFFAKFSSSDIVTEDVILVDENGNRLGVMNIEKDGLYSFSIVLQSDKVENRKYFAKSGDLNSNVQCIDFYIEIQDDEQYQIMEEEICKNIFSEISSYVDESGIVSKDNYDIVIQKITDCLEDYKSKKTISNYDFSCNAFTITFFSGYSFDYAIFSEGLN